MLPAERLFLARYLLPVTDAISAVTIEQAEQVAKLRLTRMPEGAKLLGVWQAGTPPPEGVGPVVVTPRPNPPRGGPPHGGTPAAGKVLKEEAA